MATEGAKQRLQRVDEPTAARERQTVRAAKLARKRLSPLARGELQIWAAAIYAVGSVDFLFDRAISVDGLITNGLTLRYFQYLILEMSSNRP